MTRSIVYGANVDIDMGANPITNVEDPTNDQDAATKKYVDDNAGGATFGTPAIVLGTAAGNGTVDEAIRRDSTIVAFDATVPSTQAFGDSAAAGSAAVAARRDHKHAMPADPFTGAAAGGVLDGTFPNPGLAAGVAGAGLAETGDVLSVNVDGSTLEIATDTLQLKDGGVTSAKIANGAIVDADVNASAAIAYSKLALASSIVSADIVDGTIAQADLAAALVTALSGFSTTWTVIVKANDTSRNSVTVVSADPELQFTATSGGLYEYQAYVIYVSASGAGTPDIKFGYGEDNTARGLEYTACFNSTDAAAGQTVLGQQNSGHIAGTAATNRALLTTGWHIGNGGTFSFAWAQNTSSGSPNDTTVKTGSVLRYRRIL